MQPATCLRNSVKRNTFGSYRDPNKMYVCNTKLLKHNYSIQRNFEGGKLL